MSEQGMLCFFPVRTKNRLYNFCNTCVFVPFELADSLPKVLRNDRSYFLHLRIFRVRYCWFHFPPPSESITGAVLLTAQGVI